MSRKIVKYKQNLKAAARKLRKNSTLAEVLLWRYLRARQLRGYKFHRQMPIAKYIVDFYCKDLMLAIEIDGESHNTKYDSDIRRQKEIESVGIHFLRFADSDVKQNIQEVLKVIEGWIIKNGKVRG